MENNDKWDYSHILGFCGASVQKLERMMLDVDDKNLLDCLETAKVALRNSYRYLHTKSDTQER